MSTNAQAPTRASDRYKQELISRSAVHNTALILELWDRINWGYVFANKRGRIVPDRFWDSLWRKDSGARYELVQRIQRYDEFDCWCNDRDIYALEFPDGVKYKLVRHPACDCIPSPRFNDKKAVLEELERYLSPAYASRDTATAKIE